MRALVFSILFIVGGVLIYGDDEPRVAMPESDFAVTAGKPDEEAASCEEEWRECESLRDYHKNNVEDNAKARVACKRAAQEAARFGDPEIPWSPFGTTLVHRDAFMHDGIVHLREKDAQFQNGFGAMQNVIVDCKYSLKTKTVLNLDVID